MTKDNLPEEKLLKLIRAQRPGKPRPNAPGASDAKKIWAPQITLRAVNLMLVVTAFSLSGLLAYRVFFAAEQARVVPGVLSAPKAGPLVPQDVSADKKPFEYYRAQFAKRDLFERPLDQVAASASSDLTKRYKLVGIVLGDAPEAIIEDQAAKRTMFVHPGDRLDSVEVKTIEEGRIMLLQEGLEIELKQ